MILKTGVAFKPNNADAPKKKLEFTSDPEYYYNFTEWLVRNGQMIATSSDPVSAGINTHYTVPVGYNFYLSNVAIWGVIVNPAIIMAFVKVFLTANGTLSTLGQISGHSGATVVNISSGPAFVENFNPPILMKSGDLIYYNAGYFDDAGLSTFGYLIPVSKDVKV